MSQPNSLPNGPDRRAVLMAEIELLLAEAHAFIATAQQKVNLGLELDDADRRVVAALTLAVRDATRQQYTALDE